MRCSELLRASPPLLTRYLSGWTAPPSVAAELPLVRLLSRAMAYMCIVASVPSDRVAEIRTPADISRVASKVGVASHYIVLACPEIQDAMDGGTPLDTDTWHPLRGFMLHGPAAVQQHATRLAIVASDTTNHPNHLDDFVRAELTKVVDIFRHASAAGEAIVTSLDLTRTGKKK